MLRVKKLLFRTLAVVAVAGLAWSATGCASTSGGGSATGGATDVSGTSGGDGTSGSSVDTKGTTPPAGSYGGR